jgi:hypothetical protein
LNERKAQAVSLSDLRTRNQRASWFQLAKIRLTIHSAGLGSHHSIA